MTAQERVERIERYYKGNDSAKVVESIIRHQRTGFGYTGWAVTVYAGDDALPYIYAVGPSLDDALNNIEGRLGMPADR